MTRSTEYTIRVRPDLISRLQQAAKRRDVSINQEMVARLEQSFEHGSMLKLNKITPDMESKLSKITADMETKLNRITGGLETVYGRWARQERDRSMTQELMNACEALIRQLPPEVKEPLTPTITWVQEAIDAIIKIHGRSYDPPINTAGEFDER